MLGRIYRKCRSMIKEPALDFIYKTLMSPAKHFAGRKLFDDLELRRVHKALLSQNLFGIDGKLVPEFEREFAKAYGVPYAVASTSGTAALHTAVGALDLNPGDEIITAPITDMGTLIPILYQNAIPVFADIDNSYNMDPADIERKITSRTRAIMVVHLFGNPCDMDAVMKVAKKHNLPVIEDCSQAHMTPYKGRMVGTIGDIGCYSFQQAKHMTTGDGGMTITSNARYYERMKLFVDKGYARKGWGSRAYLFLAPNYRMSELTAAVGLAQLTKVKQVVKQRQRIAGKLNALLAGVQGMRVPPVTEGAESSYWMYPLYFDSLDINALAEKMQKKGVWAGAGYTGKPIYLCTEALSAKKTFGTSQFPFNSAFEQGKHEYKPGLCPIAEETLNHLVTVPLNECWTDERIEKTARVLKETIAEITGAKPVTSAASPVPQNAVSAPSADAAPRKRVAIIGCGQMGRWHLDAYKKDPRAEVVAFVDTNRSRAEEFAKGLTAGVYTSHTDLISKEKLAGVSICTVPSTHRGIVMDLLDAGIPVLCEKPLAVNSAEAREMTEKARDKKTLLLTAFKFRFFEEVLKAKEIIGQGSLGRIMGFRLMFGGYLNMEGSWYADKAVSGGGVVMDNGPHALDLVRCLLGDVAQVTARMGHAQKLKVEDTAAISCVLKSGATGIIDLSWSIAVPASSYLEIYGESGALCLDFKGVSYKFKTWDEYKRVPNAGNQKAAFNRQISHFVDALEGKAPDVTTPEDGLKAQELIDAAYQSLKNTESSPELTGTLN